MWLTLRSLCVVRFLEDESLAAVSVHNWLPRVGGRVSIVECGEGRGSVGEGEWGDGGGADMRRPLARRSAAAAATRLHSLSLYISLRSCLILLFLLLLLLF